MSDAREIIAHQIPGTSAEVCFGLAESILNRLTAAGFRVLGPDDVKVIRGEALGQTKRERDELAKAFAESCSIRERLASNAAVAETRLAEALKTLEPFACITDLIDRESEGMSDSDEFELLFHNYLMASWPVSMFHEVRRVVGGGQND